MTAKNDPPKPIGPMVVTTGRLIRTCPIGAPMPATEFTTINKSWSWKMFIFLIVLFAFGCWGLYDAAYLYPQRGIKYAEYVERDYLKYKLLANQATTVSIGDPATRLRELKQSTETLNATRQRAAGLQTGSPEERVMAPQLADVFAHDWLSALRLVGRLTPQYTSVASPAERFKELVERLAQTESPKALNDYDIPLQWGFCALGFVGALWVLWLIAKVFKTRYGWDPATQTLYLPGGRELTPDQITEFDKRKWSKFFITLNTSSGPSVTLDLLRYAPLEEWVLAMERTRFPESVQAEASEAQASETPPESDKPASE